jgi:hypothetical protein
MNLTFTAPAMLIGLLAAGIPVLLHLIATTRAPREYLPTVRFLREAIVVTSRRRQVRRWLLLWLRSLALGLMALALAEPMTRWLAPVGLGSNTTIAIVLDNSLSMSQRTDGQPVIEHARNDIHALLTGDNQPRRTGLWLTNGTLPGDATMTAQLDDLRDAIDTVTLDDQPAPLSRTASRALDALVETSSGSRILCLVTDMQAVSADALVDLTTDPTDNVTLLLVAPNDGVTPTDIGVARIEVAGHQIVNADVTLNATLINAGPQAILADADLTIDDAPTGRSARVRLPPGSDAASETPISLSYQLMQPGPTEGEIRLDVHDAFDANNVRRFTLQPEGPIDVLIVAGDGRAGQFNPPGSILELALDPFAGTDSDVIRVERIPHEQFSPAMLDGQAAVFFCQVPTFDTSQIAAIDRFVRDGGLATFLLGDGPDPTSYNAIQTEGGTPLLPVTLAPPIGRATYDAPAIATEWNNTDHPYLTGLYPEPSRYPTLLAHRLTPLERNATVAATLIRLAGGAPLLIGRGHGEGRILVCAVPDDPSASNAMTEPLLPAILLRAIFIARPTNATDGAINPPSAEMDLTTTSKPELLDRLSKNGFTNVIMARSLDEARDQLDEQAAGDNWWDVLAIIVAGVLLIEAFIANRNPLSEDDAPR